MAKSAKATEAATTAETEQMDISQAEGEKNETDSNAKTTETTAGVTYTVAEFASAAAKIFDRPLHQDIVTGAFLMAGKKEATKEEAAKLVSDFLGKEIKLK